MEDELSSVEDVDPSPLVYVDDDVDDDVAEILELVVEPEPADPELAVLVLPDPEADPEESVLLVLPDSEEPSVLALPDSEVEPVSVAVEPVPSFVESDVD